VRFEEMANPHWFHRDPTLAWGFYGHRLGLYRQTEPHAGFQQLLTLARERPIFVYTSNVDGAFQNAGFTADSIFEIHGSLHHLQCLNDCGQVIWPAHDVNVNVNMQTLRALEPLPSCLRCHGLARPNVLMFGDWRWDESRTAAQARRYRSWTGHDTGNLVIVELGAGTSVPSVRHECEDRADRARGTLIRINPRESHGPAGTISVSTGALEGLTRIAEILGLRSFT
jgi:NAD-dependent SIR2 family protein deacetylase